MHPPMLLPAVFIIGKPTRNEAGDLTYLIGTQKPTRISRDMFPT